MKTRALTLSVLLGMHGTAALAAEFASHPPMRPLPEPSQRALPDTALRFADSTKGDDAADGSKEHPWKTLAFAVKQLKPGDTLVLRGGIFYEAIKTNLKGTAEQPITLRAHPGELAIIDAGIREFYESPATAWEPCPDGAPGEYRSTKTYTEGGSYGNFADSMVPLHRYINMADMRSTNEFWRHDLTDRADDPGGLYCGPGTRRDDKTGRIHARLAHTQLAGLGDNAYRGETDPRKLPLIIAGHEYGLVLEKARHLHLQDLVIRGAKRAAIEIDQGENIVLDGVTLYGGQIALRMNTIKGLRVVDSALRGHAAPWHSRATHKYRSMAGYLILAGGGDFEFERCELTDHHDFIAMSEADHVRIHDCFVENFNDDAFEPGPKRARARIEIFQNYISRCLNPFTAHAKKMVPVAGEPGSGVFIYRNIVDLRQGTFKSQPEQADPTGAFVNLPTFIIAHDHGSPVHPTYFVYHNTFLLTQPAYRNYYDFTWGAHMRGGAVRRVFNNIFLQIEGLPGENMTMLSADDDYQSDGNLKWGVKEGPKFSGDFFAKFRASPLFEASKKQYAPGWGTHDVFADPRFVAFDGQSTSPADVHLQSGSPAIDAGVPVPADWPDTLRANDTGKPDIGAFPVKSGPMRVGVRGRITVPSAP